MIDLRSDTVTLPTLEMRNRMYNAIVGDDVMKEDTTVNELQNRLSNMFNKEDALFFPSGTMANLTSILTWCEKRGSEIIVGDKSHIFLFEQAGASQFGGVSFRTLQNLDDGSFDIENIYNCIRDDDIHEPITKLICIENTHNVCGGTILPIKFLEELRELSNNKNIPIHLDGARLWNAIAELNVKPDIISKYVDSLSVCFSKGLGAPVGSVLLGDKDFIRKALRIRKALGGGMRQSGILAAAALQALDDFEAGILVNDHILTKKLYEGLLQIKYLQIDNKNVKTNIIFANVVTCTFDANYISEICKNNGILIGIWSPKLIRFVVHRNILERDIDIVLNILSSIK
jgi:threonine aldolase